MVYESFVILIVCFAVVECLYLLYKMRGSRYRDDNRYQQQLHKFINNQDEQL